MMKTLSAASALAILLASGCSEKPEPPKPLPPPPSITSFTASAQRIDPGQSVTLSFTAQDATSAELVDGRGNAIVLSGNASAGSATLTPDATDVYVLRVSGEGGRDTAFARVAVGEDLKDVFLAAVPAEIQSGDTTQLLWSAFRARAAKIDVSTGEEIALDLAVGDSGIVEVQPARSTTYRLVATGVDAAQPKTAEVKVTAHAAVESFSLSTQAAKVGEAIVASWKTRGAEEVILSEVTFGELARVSAPAELAQVDEGSFIWTVPAALPGGQVVADGQPLRFTLAVKQADPAATIEQRIRAFVGDGPRIEAFQTPSAATAGKRPLVSWTTTNAAQVELQVNGLTVFQTLPTDLARAAQGSYSLQPIGEDLAVTLIARTSGGAEVRQTRPVELVAGPAITTFTLPTAVNAVGDAAQATWTTTDATYVALRTLGGPVTFATADAAEVASGSADVYPGNTMTWVLEAWNAAGDVVTMEKTVTVHNPGAVTAGPSPALPGTSVALEWAFEAANTLDVIGIPSATPIPDTAVATWIELDGHAQAEELFFADTNDGVAEVPLTLPFRFPFVDGVREEVFVSTNGFVSFADLGPLLANVSLATAGAPELIAPFWDNLDLGAAGKVLYLVEGTSFPRRLTIQWTDVTLVSNASAQLTFQLQLEETGAFRFVYQNLTGTGSAGEGATIGVRVGDGLFVGQLSFDAAGVAAGEAHTWFASAALTGSTQLYTTRTSFYGLIQRLQGDKYVPYNLPIWVFPPESLQVTEAMVTPGSAAASARWIELYNAQPVTVNLGGVSLSTTGMAAPWELPAVMIPAHGFLVVGETTDTAQNGGAPVSHVWTGVTLDPADEIKVEVLSTAISSLAWTSSTTGESVQAPEAAIDAQGTPITCERTKHFGDGDVGTPGELNEVCFDYSLKPIPGAWEDIQATGTILIPGASTSTGYGTEMLPVPFTYFGQSYDQIHVSRAGFFSFGAPLTSAHAEPNDTVPGSAVPSGVVAPFWERLVQNTNGDLQMLRRPGYTIVAWNDYRIFNGGSTSSRLYFQVKLFDSGVIEFHYGNMGASTVAGYLTHHTGTSATTWIERVDGSAALPVNINTVNGIQANSGWRFTPNQQGN